jgi:hypothetical protein
MSRSAMDTPAQELCLLVLNTSPTLEEALVDYLLLQEHVAGFSSYTVYGHGQHAGLTVAEQVTGKRKRMQYEMVVKRAHVADILASLATEVGRDIVYWQQLVLDYGRIGTHPSERTR